MIRDLHVEYVGDDAVYLHGSYQPGEEEFLEQVGLEGAEGRQAEEQPREPVLVPAVAAEGGENPGGERLFTYKNQA